MKTRRAILSRRIFPLFFVVLLMGTLLLGGCKLSLQSFTAPDTADTGTIITLSLAGEAVDNGDDASEYGLVLQIPDKWTVLSGKADVSDSPPYSISLTENPAYESLYTAEYGYKVWVGTSTNSGGEGDKLVTATVKVLVGEFDGDIGDTSIFALKAMAGVYRDGAWTTDDPEGVVDFGAVSGDPYVEKIQVTKVFDDVAPAAVTTLTVTDACDGQAELSWDGYDEDGQGDVVQYNIYQDTHVFTDVSGMIPVATVPCGRFLEIISLPYGEEYFFAVTAVDELGNENKVVTPQSIILPEPCKGDFDQDQDVDGLDLALFASQFGRTDCPSCGNAMLGAASTESQEIENLQDDILGLRAELAAKEKQLEELVNSSAQ